MTIALPASAARFHRIPGFVLLAIAVVLMTAATWPALTSVAGMWTQDEYSHAWLIGPLAALVFLYRLPTATPGSKKCIGPAIVIAAVGLMLAGWATHNTTLSIYGLVAGIYGLAWASLGRAAMGDLSAPIGFLLFMIPLPLAVYISLSQSMQLMSSRLGVALIRLMGVVVEQDGNVIDLANGQLEVAEACSGLRYLFPLLSIAFLLAILLEDRWWKKALLFVSAFPIAIVMNACRLALIGVLVDRYGIAMAGGLQHEVEGFLVFALCVGLLLVELRLLLGIGPPGRLPAADVLVPSRRAMSALARWPSPTSFRVAAAIALAGALLLLALPKRNEVVPERRPLALFPIQIGSWSGSPHPLDADTIRALGLTDYVMADFAGPGGSPPINFYVAYYASQRIGVQVHSPRLCIPGGGWDILDLTPTIIQAADGSTFQANRVVIRKNAVKQIVYYWFEERGRHLTKETEIKLYALVDAVVRDRSDGALVRLVAPVIGDDEAAADRSLHALARDATAVLDTFVPG